MYRRNDRSFGWFTRLPAETLELSEFIAKKALSGGILLEDDCGDLLLSYSRPPPVHPINPSRSAIGP
jgi:hypothetical protein